MQKFSSEEIYQQRHSSFQQVARIPLVLILDNIRSGLNVGSIFRSADGFGIEKIYLSGYTAIPPHPEINKTALGANETVPWEFHENAHDIIRELRLHKFEIYALEQAKESIKLHAFEYDANKKYALIIGNEMKGVSEALMSEVDGSIEIVQQGMKHSLNVSVATGVAIYEFWKQNHRQIQ